MEFKSIYWKIIFVFAMIVDILILLYLVIKNLDIFLFIVIILVFYGAFILNGIWNMDERTDQALDDAARVTIRIFSLSSVILGSMFILLGHLYLQIFRVIGISLVIMSIALIYMHSVLSVYYADRMS